MPSITLFATLAFLVGRAAAVNWVLSHSMSLAVSRIDPILDEGGVAGHVHNVIGGSAFNSESSVAMLRDARGNQADTFAEHLNSPEQQAQSQCSSTNVQADKSNYWAP